MTEALDTMLADTPAATETALTVTSSDRKCRRHDWERWTDAHVICRRCGIVKDEQKSRRGKSSARRGKDYERTLAQRLGGTKVGHHGGPEDVRTGMFNVQSKVRAAFPNWMTDELAKLPRTGGRIPVLVVAQAGRTRNAIVVVGIDDWVDLHGETP